MELKKLECDLTVCKVSAIADITGKRGINSICGEAVRGVIYFCSILLPCSPESREVSKI